MRILVSLLNLKTSVPEAKLSKYSFGTIVSATKSEGSKRNFSQKEVVLALQNGYEGISLGKNRLRT